MWVTSTAVINWSEVPEEDQRTVAESGSAQLAHLKTLLPYFYITWLTVPYLLPYITLELSMAKCGSAYLAHHHTVALLNIA